MPNYKDITGQRFGKLIALSKTDTRCNESIVWQCQCDCGNISYASQGNLKSGKSKSCGCLRSEKMSNTRKSLEYVDGTLIPMLNDKIYSNNSSGVRGVCWDNRSHKWHAYITLKGKFFNLGLYDNKEDAIRSRKQAENELWKPFIDEHGEQEN